MFSGLIWPTASASLPLHSTATHEVARRTVPKNNTALRRLCALLSGLTLACFASPEAFAQSPDVTARNQVLNEPPVAVGRAAQDSAPQDSMVQLFLAQGILLFVILVLLPLYSLLIKPRTNQHTDLRGLSLPEGSIRGMLALMSLGSLVVFLVFGHGVRTLHEHYTLAVIALATLTGTTIGFYFGHRGGFQTRETPKTKKH